MTRAALVLVLLAGLGTPTPAAPRRDAPAKELAALEGKLHGEWTGHGPCQGGLTFRAHGIYERTHHGPAGVNSAGTWRVRWDALPPTLVLTCKSSGDEADEGQVAELKIIRLDDDGFEYVRPGDSSSKKPTRYARARK